MGDNYYYRTSGEGLATDAKQKMTRRATSSPPPCGWLPGCQPGGGATHAWRRRGVIDILCRLFSYFLREAWAVGGRSC
jgi:hypothetical protein